MGRHYGQYCPMAHALDLVGERWSLLVVKELLHGPLRYSDLLDRLHGCGTNTLVVRLRELEDAGIVARHRLPPPAASAVYELTATGAALKPAIAALARWGAELLGPPAPDADLQPGWLANALRLAVADAAPAARIAFRIGGETASLDAGTVTDGALAGAEATVAGDAAAFYAFVFGGDSRGLVVSGADGSVEELAVALRSRRESATALA
jgi:DNA-binding HxlR family transcriptional regulator